MPFVHSFDPDRGLDIVSGCGATLTVRRLGAEAIGLTLPHPRHGPVGLLWRDAQPDDPERFWKGHAPILFPIVGGLHGHRSRTTDGVEVRFRGLHGFVRHSVLELASARDLGDAFALVYRLAASDATRACYPFDFVFEVSYTLRPDRLDCAILVRNPGDRPLPYQVGWHPGFAAPLVAGRKRDCRLRLPGGIVRWANDADCHLTGDSAPVGGPGEFPLDEAQLDATYMLDLSAVPPEDRVAEWTDPDGSIGVRVAFPDFPHLGLWSDADAPFLCIEPWQGMDDRVDQEPFDHKFGIVHLAPGATDVRRASIGWIGGAAAH